MGIIIVIAWLAVLAVCGLAYRQPWRARSRVGVLWLFGTYRPYHAAPAASADQELADWAGSIVGVDVCARCAAPMAAGECPRCHWERPADRAPWPRLTDADRAAMAAGLDTARAIAAEPRPGAVLMPAPTDHISGAGRDAEPAAGAWRPAYAGLAPPEPPAPPQPPRGAAQVTARGQVYRNCAEHGAAICVHGAEPPRIRDAGPLFAEPPPPEPGLPPEGPGLHLAGCDGGHPEGARCNLDGDDGPGGGPWAPAGYARGAMRWAPSRRATPADAEHAADLARQDADAAEFIDAIAAEFTRLAVPDGERATYEDALGQQGDVLAQLRECGPGRAGLAGGTWGDRAVRCDAELCPYWTGHGCICAVLDLDGDDEPDQDGPGGGPWAPAGYARGAMRWAPSRRATPEDAEHAADLARQDADAAEFIDAMAAERRRYLWQIRRGFLAQRGLAF